MFKILGRQQVRLKHGEWEQSTVHDVVKLTQRLPPVLLSMSGTLFTNFILSSTPYSAFQLYWYFKLQALPAMLTYFLLFFP